MDHSSAKRHLQFKKLHFEFLSYKVRFKAGLSKNKTGATQKMRQYIHTPVFVLDVDENWILGDAEV